MGTDSKLHSPTRSDLAAHRLVAHQEEILSLFFRRIKESIPVSGQYDDSVLRDRLPEFLDAISKHLLKRPGERSEFGLEKLAGREHGNQRAALKSYNLENVLSEFRFLRRAIFEVIERSGPVSTEERDLILDAIQLGAKNAASQFIFSRTLEASFLSWTPKRRLTRWAASIAIVACATVIQWLLWPIIKPVPYIVYFPAVLIAALFADAVVVTVLGAILAQVLFVEPPGLHMAWPGDYARTLIFLINATLIQYVTIALRKAKFRADTAAREQEWAKQEAEQAIRNLEAERWTREQFVAALTHDLKTPLTAALTTAQLMIRYPEKSDVREKGASRIVHSLQRADKMIQDLLDVSRIRSGQKRSQSFSLCDLRATLDEVVDELQSQHGPRFTIEGEKPVSGYWSCLDLRRIAENLIMNALKYGNQTTPITISIRKKDDQAELRVHNHLAKDTPPLSPEELATLFEPFRRTATAEISGKKGWGLGLTLVKGLTESHGGHVFAESDASTGTTFVVTLPIDSRQNELSPAFR